MKEDMCFQGFVPKFYTWNVTKYDANFTITTSSPSAKINKHLYMFGEMLQVQQYCAHMLLPTPTLVHFHWHW